MHLDKSKKLFFLLFATLIIIKLILLFIFPREITFYLSGLTKWNYYNTMAFNIDAQAFRDGNHPGTPIYIIGSLILKIAGSKISNFYNYFYLNHIFIFILNFICTNIFFNFFKKKLHTIEIIAFLLIFTSSFNFLFGLEIIDLMSYQFSITLLLVTYFIKSLDKNKTLKLSIICALAISCKMTFLPFILTILFSKLFYFLIKKNLKEIIKIFSFFSFFYLLFNLPILGRIPRIFIDALFLREDASLIISTNQLLSGIKYANSQMFYENQLFFILIIFSFTVFLLNVSTYYKKEKRNATVELYRKTSAELKPLREKKIISNKAELNTILIFSFLIMAFYIYTFIIAGQMYAKFPDYNSIEKESILRNNYPYLSFIFINYYIAKFYFHLKLFSKKLIISFSILIFIITCSNYLIKREAIIKNSLESRNELIEKIKPYIDLDKNIIAYFNHGTMYGFGDEIFHLNGNSIEGNEYFTEEIINLYPNFRLFRFYDIIDQIKKVPDGYLANENTTSIIKKKLKKFDPFLKNNLPNNLYEIFSHQSKNSTLNNNIQRNDDIYTFQKNKKYPPADVILFTHKGINNGYIDESEIYNHLKKKVIIKKTIRFTIKNSEWFMYLID